MGFFARLSVVAVASVIAGGALLTSESISAAVMGQEALKARQDAMKGLSKNMKAIEAFVKEGKGSADDVAAKAREISATAKKITELTPKGTGRGDFSDKETRALPIIWTDWAGYEKAAGGLAAESAKLAEVASGGDKDKIAEQFEKVGKVGCGTCHKTYRGEKVK